MNKITRKFVRRIREEVYIHIYEHLRSIDEIFERKTSKLLKHIGADLRRINGKFGEYECMKLRKKDYNADLVKEVKDIIDVQSMSEEN